MTEGQLYFLPLLLHTHLLPGESHRLRTSDEGTMVSKARPSFRARESTTEASSRPRTGCRLQGASTREGGRRPPRPQP